MIKQSQLMSAAQFGNLAKVKQLVKSGANIHEWNDYALRFAAKNGHLKIVKYLVQSGADVNVLSDNPLRVALKSCRYEWSFASS